MPRININEYLYIDYEMESDGRLKIIDQHNIPHRGVIYRDNGDSYVVELPNGKKIIKIDKKSGSFEWLYKVTEDELMHITTFEMINDFLDDGVTRSYERNREMFDKGKEFHDEIDTTKDLHTHFIQVLSAEQLLDFLNENGIESIFVEKGPTSSIAIIKEDDYINLNKNDLIKKYNCREISIEDAKKDSKILGQLGSPIDHNTDFKYFESCFPIRSALILLACSSAKNGVQANTINQIKKLNRKIKELEKKIKDFEKDNLEEINNLIEKKNRLLLDEENETNLKELKGIKENLENRRNEEAQKKIKEKYEYELKEKQLEVSEKKTSLKEETYKDLLSKNLKVLRDEHGVKYVEFSYSNTSLIKYLIENPPSIDGIEYKFLVSQHRVKNKGKGFMMTCDDIAEMLDEGYTGVAGFDLMGFEEKILKSEKLDTLDDFTDSGVKCKTLYTKLKYIITSMITSSINLEMKPTLRLHAGEVYYEEGNPNLTLELLEKIEEDIKREYEEIYSILDDYRNNLITKEELAKLKQNNEEYESLLKSMIEKGSNSKEDQSKLESLEKNSRKYRIILKAQNLSKKELNTELERIKNLSKEFLLKDRINIRIGHGLHFNDNKEYYRMLRHFGVTVELCLSSNFKLGNLKTLDESPYDKYRRNGINVVVGPDGEGYFMTSMKQEASLVSMTSNGQNKSFVEEENDSRKPTGYLDTFLNSFIKKLSTVSNRKEAKDYSDSGLNMDVSVDEYINSIDNTNSQFVESYESIKGKKKYVNNYFKNLYVVNGDTNIREVEKLRVEIKKTSNFVMDMLSNELYYNNSELQLIIKSFERINTYFEEQKYTKAAMLLVSLQGVMDYETGLGEVAYLIKENDLDFAKCLNTRVIDKYKFDEIDRVNNNTNNRNNWSINNDDYTNLKNITEEYHNVLKTIHDNYKAFDSNVEFALATIDDCLKKVNNCEEEISDSSKNNKYLAAVGIVCLQRYLGNDTKLHEIDDILNQENYDLTKYVSDLSYLKNHEEGGRKR